MGVHDYTLHMQIPPLFDKVLLLFEIHTDLYIYFSVCLGISTLVHYHRDIRLYLYSVSPERIHSISQMPLMQTENSDHYEVSVPRIIFLIITFSTAIFHSHYTKTPNQAFMLDWEFIKLIYLIY